jgi:hypothetical protein
MTSAEETPSARRIWRLNRDTLPVVQRTLSLLLALSTVWACSSHDASDPGFCFGVVDPATDECVRCLSAEDCQNAPEGPVCLADRACGCDADADCNGNLGGVACLTTKQCGCNTSADCYYSLFPVCATMEGQCIQP